MNNFTEKQKAIINVSLEIILKKGIQNLTIKNIADEFEITDAAIYKHFKSKNEILYGIIEIFKEDSDRLLNDILSSSTKCIEKIKTFYLNRCLEFSKNKLLTTIMFSEELFKNDKELIKKINSILESHRSQILQSIIRGQTNNEIRKDIDCEKLFIIIMGSLRFLVTKWQLSNYSFDLLSEGSDLWESVEILIK